MEASAWQPMGKEISAEILRTRSYFKITSSLSNSGKNGVSVRQQGLLRVYIGTGNYVDLKLNLKDYIKNAHVAANGSRIVTYLSNEISSLPKGDQQLINTYWQQSVQAILFIEDIRGNHHASNGLPFSEGLSQKAIYDRLAREASKAN